MTPVAETAETAADSGTRAARCNPPERTHGSDFSPSRCRIKGNVSHTCTTQTRHCPQDVN